MTDYTAERLQKIRDWFALCDAQARYCRMLDERDWDGLAALMTEDYTIELPGDPQTPELHGRDTAIEHIRGSVRAGNAVHQVHSPEIEIDGDEARAIWAIHERLLWPDEARGVSGFGHYHQRWVRRDGGWKLASLRLERLLMDTDPGSVWDHDTWTPSSFEEMRSRRG